MHTNSPNKPKKFKQTSSCQKADGNCFLGIHAARDHNNVRNVLQNTHKKNLSRAIQNKRRGMPTYGVVLRHDNVRPHTTARTQALLEHFDWELFDHPSYSPDLAPRNYHQLTYLKNWLGLQPN
jgi:hypothetical protein